MVERGEPALLVAIAPLLELWEQTRRLLKELTKEVVGLCKGDERCQRLMSVPGVGPLVS